MADHTNIEWTDATWQVVTGCDIVSPGCANCYAMKMAGTRLKNHPSRVGLTKPSRSGPVWTGEVRFNEQWLDQPLRWRKPRRIFVAAHGDLFHPGVPDDVLDKVFAVMALARHHTFQVLTKRPERMREYVHRLPSRQEGDPVWPQNPLERTAHDIFEDRGYDGDPAATRAFEAVHDWPLPNVWLGVSVEDQKHAEDRIPHLLATPAAKRFASAEPLLGPVDLTRLDLLNVFRVIRAVDDENYPRNCFDALRGHSDIPPIVGAEPDWGHLDWVIVGGESQAGARPMHPDWARSLRDQCAAAGVAFHFKQWGEWVGVETERSGWTLWQNGMFEPGTGAGSKRIGKKAAGRLLDGRTHDEVP